MTYGHDTFVCRLWREIMNHLALLSILADSLHVWALIPIFNSFSLKMSLMHFVHVTIDIGPVDTLYSITSLTDCKYAVTNVPSHSKSKVRSIIILKKKKKWKHS